MQYKAFISYSHVLDSNIAPALHSALERIGKPWYVRRSMNVFRDTADLSTSPALWPKIETALAQSEYLLLLASPKAAQSRWVAKEVAYWLEHGPRENFLIILTDGVIAWDNVANDFDWSRTTALPEFLRGQFSGEPLYANFVGFRGTNLTLSNEKFGDQVAMVASALLGKSRKEVYAEDLRQHKKTMRLYRLGVIAISALTIIAFAAACWAIVSEFSKRNTQTIADKTKSAFHKETNRAKNEEAVALKSAFNEMTVAGLRAMDLDHTIEALHYFAAAVDFAETKPENYSGTQTREYFRFIRK